MDRLNLGCGTKAYDGWLNADKIPNPGVNLVLDLWNPPLPIPNDSMDYILAANFMEHIPIDRDGDLLFDLMADYSRVLRPGGILEVISPHPERVVITLQSPGHTRLIGPYTFECFAPNFKTASAELRASPRWRMKAVKNRRSMVLGPISDYHFRKYLGLEVGHYQTINIQLENLKENGQ